MIYGSVCSGIEAASVAWSPLGWQAAFFAEIDAFPSALLAHYYPDVPNLGDMTRFQEWPDADLDVLVGGTPCQSFSIAGLRKGLADPRGNLALTFLEIAQRYRPRWILWENVPGVLSQDGGRAFGSFLGGLEELGYGWAYRILDAQYWNLAQRRARVFVVGSARGWASAAAVLFEPASLSGHPAPSRAARKDIARPIGAGAPGGSGYRNDADTADNLIARHVSTRGGQRYDSESDTLVAHSLRAEGFDASEDGTGRGTPIVPVAIQERATSENPDSGPGGAGFRDDGVAYTLEARAVPQAVAFAQNQREEVRELNAAGAVSAIRRGDAKNETLLAFSNTAGDTTLGMSKPGVPPLTSRHGDPGNVLNGNAVRRLTPRECERLQGFPDSWTLVPYRGKPAADGPRYKALGNSMAVPVMRWIGERIQLVENLLNRS